MCPPRAFAFKRIFSGGSWLWYYSGSENIWALYGRRSRGNLTHLNLKWTVMFALLFSCPPSPPFFYRPSARYADRAVSRYHQTLQSRAILHASLRLERRSKAFMWSIVCILFCCYCGFSFGTMETAHNGIDHRGNSIIPFEIWNDICLPEALPLHQSSTVPPSTDAKMVLRTLTLSDLVFCNLSATNAAPCLAHTNRN